jgi:glycosyltransferase involved in cell wall biosynthesis
MITGLRENGVEVLECHETLWRGIEDRIQTAHGGWINPAFIKRVISTYFRLIKKYNLINDYDILVIGYPGQLDIFIGWVLALIKKRPLVWDVFMSIYLIILERKLNEKSKISAWIVNKIEWLGLRLPDRLIIDTQQYSDWLQKMYGLTDQRIFLVPTGADDRIFQRAPQQPKKKDTFLILYYGTYISNHNVPLMIEAAHLLSGNKSIQFKFIGNGPDREKSEEIARSYSLENILFVDWLDKEDLVKEVFQADICLGVFGNTPQSLMTIQNKIYECLAMGKVVISGDSETIQSTFEHRKHIYLCKREAKSLAAAIGDLFKNQELCEQIAKSGYERFCSNFTSKKIGETFKSHIISLLPYKK